MTRPPFYAAPPLFAAAFLFDAALPLVGRVFFVPRQQLLQQQGAYFPHQCEQQFSPWRSQRDSPRASVFFADAFSIPPASRVSARILHPTAAFCGGVSSLRSSSQSSLGGSTSSACTAEQERLVKQGMWKMRTSATTSAALSESATAAPTPVLHSGATTFRTVPTSASAVSAGAGRLSETSAVTEMTTASVYPAGDAPLNMARSALPSLRVTRGKTTLIEAPLHSTPADSGSTAFEIGSSTAAAAAREAEPVKTPNPAAPLGPVVTRKDLVASLTAELQLPRADVERTIAALLRHITANLEVGRKVSISKFGSFNVRRRGERVARNPRTGETLSVAAATFPTFSFSKVLKERVRDVVPVNNEDGIDDEVEVKDEEQPQSDKKGQQLFPWPRKGSAADPQITDDHVKMLVRILGGRALTHEARRTAERVGHKLPYNRWDNLVITLLFDSGVGKSICQTKSVHPEMQNRAPALWKDLILSTAPEKRPMTRRHLSQAYRKSTNEQARKAPITFMYGRFSHEVSRNKAQGYCAVTVRELVRGARVQTHICCENFLAVLHVRC